MARLDSDRDQRLLWVATRILPHEGEVRAWLRRQGARPEDVDDLMQEAYARLWATPDPQAIGRPRAYLFQVVRSILIDQVRRASVVHISVMANLETLPAPDDCDSPERIVSGRLDLERVQALIEALPDRCRRIMRMRKVEGLSQREIARALGVSEGVVENELGRGLRSILAAFESGDPGEVRRTLKWKAKSRVRR